MGRNVLNLGKQAVRERERIERKNGKNRDPLLELFKNNLNLHGGVLPCAAAGRDEG